MIKIEAPRLNANEDSISLVEILKKNNQFCEENEPICVFETTKSTVDFLAPNSGFVYFLQAQGSEIKCGEVFACIDSKKIDKAILKDYARNSDKVIATKKAEKLMVENFIDPQNIKTTGVIRLKEVEDYIKSNK